MNFPSTTRSCSLRGRTAARARRRGSPVPARLPHPATAATCTRPTGSSSTCGGDRRVLRHPGHDLDGPADPRRAASDTVRSTAASCELYYDGYAAAARRLADPRGRLLGLQHAARDADERADARHRRLAHASASSAQARRRPLAFAAAWSPNASPSGSSARATSASSPRPASPSSATRSSASTSTRTRSRACERGEIPIYEPGLEDLVAQEPRAAALLDRAWRRAGARAAAVRRASARRRPTRATPTCRAVHAVVDAMPASDRHALVMKSTVPVGTGARSSAVRRARQGGLPLRLVPGVPQGGLRGRGLPAPRPRRRRRRRRLGRRRRRRPVRAARRRRSCAPTSPPPR